MNLYRYFSAPELNSYSDIIKDSIDKGVSIRKWLETKKLSKVPFKKLSYFEQFLCKLEQIVGQSLLHMTFPTCSHVNDPLENVSWVAADVFRNIIIPEIDNKQATRAQRKEYLDYRRNFITQTMKDHYKFEDNNKTYYLYRASKYLTTQSAIDSHLASGGEDTLNPSFCSLSAANDHEHEKIKHMMAYYCRGGHGVRIGINFEKLDGGSNFKNLGSDCSIGRVRYIDKILKIGYEEVKNGRKWADLKNHHERIICFILTMLHKDKIYAYEDEWRIISNDTDRVVNKFNFKNSGTLTDITIMPESRGFEDNFVEWVKLSYNNITINVLDWDDGDNYSFSSKSVS